MPRKALFLDRDGVINTPPPDGGYILTPETFHLMPGIVETIKWFQRRDYGSTTNDVRGVVLMGFQGVDMSF